MSDHLRKCKMLIAEMAKSVGSWEIKCKNSDRKMNGKRKMKTKKKLSYKKIKIEFDKKIKEKNP